MVNAIAGYIQMYTKLCKNTFISELKLSKIFFMFTVLTKNKKLFLYYILLHSTDNVVFTNIF